MMLIPDSNNPWSIEAFHLSLFFFYINLKNIAMRLSLRKILTPKVCRAETSKLSSALYQTHISRCLFVKMTRLTCSWINSMSLSRSWGCGKIFVHQTFMILQRSQHQTKDWHHSWLKCLWVFITQQKGFKFMLMWSWSCWHSRR